MHSHPQALGQCAGFLREQLPGAAIVAERSTADAVRAVAEGGTLAGAEPHAAIGTRHAARLYGAVVLAEGIEDDAENATRFAWIARGGGSPPDRAGGGRDPQDRARLLGRRRRHPGLARRLPHGVLLARDQPHADRVAAAPDRPRALHVLLRPRGRGFESCGRRRDRRTARPLRGGARARDVPGRRMTAASTHYTPASDGHSRTPSASGVRAARRPPAARIERRRLRPLVGWSCAGAQRDV